MGKVGFLCGLGMRGITCACGATFAVSYTFSGDEAKITGIEHPVRPRCFVPIITLCVMAHDNLRQIYAKVT